MNTTSVNNLWKMLSNLSGTDALLLGFLLLCAVGGALVALYIAISALLDARRQRRADRIDHAARIADKQT